MISVRVCLGGSFKKKRARVIVLSLAFWLGELDVPSFNFLALADRYKVNTYLFLFCFVLFFLLFFALFCFFTFFNLNKEKSRK